VNKTRPGFLVIGASLMGFLLVSSAFAAHVNATTNYEGSDDAEFDCTHNYSVDCPIYSGYVIGEAIVSTSVTYSPSKSFVSLQYNPDESISNSYQTKDYQGGRNWFQTGVLGNYTASCVLFTTQIYDLTYGGLINDWFSNSGNCYSVTGLFHGSSGGDATWEITEYTDSSGYVNEVDYFAEGAGSGYGSYSATLHPETYFSPYGDFLWLRSNLCWCGVSGTGNTANADFTAGAGYLYAESGGTLYALNPPIYIETAENSNMEYGCFSGNGTSNMDQSFGLSGIC
jgi:hypothetical protein